VKQKKPECRSKLAALCGERHQFSAVFSRLGTDTHTGKRTVFLRHVRADGSDEILAEHVWILAGALEGQWMAQKSKTKVVIDAKVISYLKGKRHSTRSPQRVSYTLADIRRIERKEQ
jgi:hypothetical protein